MVVVQAWGELGFAKQEQEEHSNKRNLLLEQGMGKGLRATQIQPRQHSTVSRPRPRAFPRDTFGE